MFIRIKYNSLNLNVTLCYQEFCDERAFVNMLPL